MYVKLDAGSEVSIQQYTEEQGKVKKYWPRSYTQGPQQARDHGAYVQDRGYQQERGQRGHELHLVGDEGGNFALDLVMEDQLESWM